MKEPEGAMDLVNEYLRAVAALAVGVAVSVAVFVAV